MDHRRALMWPGKRWVGKGNKLRKPVGTRDRETGKRGLFYEEKLEKGLKPDPGIINGTDHEYVGICDKP